MTAVAAPARQRRLPAWLVALAGYLVLMVLFFWQPIFDPRYAIPEGGGDLLAFYWPYLRYAADSLQQGVFPWWNPYLNSGTPFAADVQSALYYPLNWPLFALGRPLTFDWVEWSVMLHYPLAGFFTWLLARRLGVGGWGAFAAGAIYAFGGAMVARLGHSTALAAASWLPLLLLCLHAALCTAGGSGSRFGWLRWSVAGGLVLSIILFAGHTQIALYCAMVVALLWAWWLGADLLSARSSETAPRLLGIAGLQWRSVASLPVLLTVGLAGAAIQLVPLAELLGLSIRADLSFERATEFAVPPLSLIQFLVPHFFGTSGTNYWGITGSMTEGYGYVGIVTLVLAGLGLALHRRDRMAWFFAVLALLGLVLALGQETALYGWLYRFVPGFGQVRAPGRLLLLVDLGLAVLAGYGVHALGATVTARVRPWRSMVVAAAVGVLTLLLVVGLPTLAFALLTSQGADPTIFSRVRDALSSLVMAAVFLAAGIGLLLIWRRWPRSRLALLPAAASCLVILDLFSANIGFNPGRGAILANFEHDRVIAFIESQPGPLRIDAFTDVGAVWAPNLPLIDRIDDAGGSPINPLLLARYQQYWANLGSRSVPGYELLNVEYVVGSKQVQLDWARFEPALTDAPRVNLHRNLRALPRAMLVPVARIVADEETLRLLKTPEWNPRSQVLLRQRPGLIAGPGAPAALLAPTVTHPDSNTTVVRGTSAGGWLLLNEVGYPGWRATIDGTPVPIETANYVMQAIALPDGDFEAVFSFQPMSWWLGALISGLTWTAALLFLASGLLPRRAAQTGAVSGK